MAKHKAVYRQEKRSKEQKRLKKQEEKRQRQFNKHGSEQTTPDSEGSLQLEEQTDEVQTDEDQTASINQEED